MRSGSTLTLVLAYLSLWSMLSRPIFDSQLARQGVLTMLLCGALTADLGCNSESDVLGESEVMATPPPVETVSQPAAELGDLATSGSSLPPDHPPIETETAEGAALAWVTPEAWIVDEPAHPMRLAQWSLPGDAGAATCVLSSTAGGTVVENVRRWIGQFEASDGVDPNMVAELADVVLAGYPTTLLRTHGTYMDPGVGMQGDVTPRDEWAIFGAIVEIPNAMHFFKCTGPLSTIDAHAATLESFVRSFQPAG